MIKAILFDLDGVLVHTDEYHYLAWKSMAVKLGVPFDRKINDRLRGVSRMKSLDIILERYVGPPLTQAQKNALAEGKNQLYRQLLLQMNPQCVDREVPETLKKLRKKGYLLAVGSSSKNAGRILEQTELLPFFDAVADGNQIACSKPDPEVFLKAAALLNMEPGQCAVVEDAVAGIDAACAAGMLPVGISGAARYEKTVHSIGTLPDLINIF